MGDNEKPRDGRTEPPKQKEVIPEKSDTILDRFRLSEDDQRDFRHAEAFKELTAEYIKNSSPEITQKKEITCLYPGGGHHIAPIEIGLQLLEQCQKVETINFIYTGIDDVDGKKTLDLLEKLAQRGLFKETPRKGEEHMRIFEYTTSRGILKKIKITASGRAGGFRKAPGRG